MQVVPGGKRAAGSGSGPVLMVALDDNARQGGGRDCLEVVAPVASAAVALGQKQGQEQEVAEVVEAAAKEMAVAGPWHL